jgi:methionine-rich copper-binding protein CopC
MRSSPSTRDAGLAFVAWLIGANVALAHSELRQAEPAPNSQHKSPPREVKLTFSERLEPAYSTLRVNDAEGVEVDRHDAHVDPGDPLLLRASLGPLGPGAYTVTWRALSLDPHMSEGHFAFQVE